MSLGRASAKQEALIDLHDIPPPHSKYLLVNSTDQLFMRALEFIWLAVNGKLQSNGLANKILEQISLQKGTPQRRLRQLS